MDTLNNYHTNCWIFPIIAIVIVFIFSYKYNYYNIYTSSMCVDDYEFRHYTARREKICKRFLFRSEEGSERVFLVNISQF